MHSGLLDGKQKVAIKKVSSALGFTHLRMVSDLYMQSCNKVHPLACFVCHMLSNGKPRRHINHSGIPFF